MVYNWNLLCGLLKSEGVKRKRLRVWKIAFGVWFGKAWMVDVVNGESWSPKVHIYI